MKTGIHSNIPSTEYFALRAINNSGLTLIAQSPLHYWASCLDPMAEEKDPSPTMRLGSAIHCAVLEPDEFQKRYAVMPDGLDRRTKEGKAAYAELELSGKTILSATEALKVGRVAANVRGSKSAQTILGVGKSEQTMIWKDKDTGVLCKARADWITDGATLLLDLKSTQDARHDAFSRSCANYNYHRQAAWYLDGAEAVFGADKNRTFLFLAHETDAPYACAFYFATPEMLELGRALNRELVKTYAKCLEKNLWHGYPDEIMPLQLPKWMTRSTEKTEKTELELY